MELSPINTRSELQLIAAKVVLGQAHSWDIPPIADRALANGDYSPALAELAAFVNPIMSEVEPLFIKALADFGLRMPSPADAAWLIVRQGMLLIVSNAELTRATLSLIKETSYAVRDVLPDKQYRGDSLDLGALIGIYWLYTEPEENCFEGRVNSDETERHALLDSLVKDEARQWLERHGELAPPPSPR